MLEARISYLKGRTHTVEANDIEMLKSKCQPFINNIEVYNIDVVKLEHVGSLKNELGLDLL
ncbi:hypothetical protein [Clostridium tagluense]|uniref:Uncharacterized protein n=1 Tax=Clostridium tagluense TaxID=360422 RepID=A0A401UQ94_9CLOT|nr:hypothetical protein [Clostridium tagluense]GCD11690.1 hypothetical protein Ctaglu_33130 [Clostridium tagluense]